MIEVTQYASVALVLFCNIFKKDVKILVILIGFYSCSRTSIDAVEECTKLFFYQFHFRGLLDALCTPGFENLAVLASWS